MPGPIRQLGEQVRSSAASIALVIASLVAALAAVAGLTSWVAIAAAVTATASGVQVLRAAMVIPLRLRRAENAAVVVFVGEGKEKHPRGSAFQIAPGRWVTAAFIAQDCPSLALGIDGSFIACQVLHADEAAGLAVLEADSSWPWHVAVARSSPQTGDRLKITAWSTGWGGSWGSPRQFTYEYVVSGRAENNLVPISGMAPPPGFAGGPAIDIKTGRVIGVCTRTAGKGMDGGTIQLISGLPAEFL